MNQESSCPLYYRFHHIIVIIQEIYLFWKKLWQIAFISLVTLAWKDVCLKKDTLTEVHKLAWNKTRTFSSKNPYLFTVPALKMASAKIRLSEAIISFHKSSLQTLILKNVWIIYLADCYWRRMWFRGQIYRCQINGTLAWEFSALGYSGSEYSGLTGSGLARNGVSGSSVNQ